MLIKNRIIPFHGFTAVNILGLVFVRSKDWGGYDSRFRAMVLNHEKIHTRQMLELCIVGFYIIYLIEWIFKGYNNISFEKEAYANETNVDYLKTRKWYSQWRKSF